MFKCCYSKKEKTNEKNIKEKREPLPETIEYNLKNIQNIIICSGCNGSFDKYNDKELIAGFCIGKKCRYYDRWSRSYYCINCVEKQFIENMCLCKTCHNLDDNNKKQSMIYIGE